MKNIYFLIYFIVVHNSINAQITVEEVYNLEETIFDLAIDVTSDNLYAITSFNRTINKFNLTSSTAPTTILDFNANPNPSSFRYHDGYLYVSNNFSQLYRLNPSIQNSSFETILDDSSLSIKDFTFKGNTIYFTDSKTNGKIYKADITTFPLNYTEVLTFTSDYEPDQIEIHNNTLFVYASKENYTTNKLFKVDLNVSSPTPKEVIDLGDDTSVYLIDINNNKIYLTTLSFGSDTIHTLNIDDTSAGFSLLIDNIGTIESGLAFKNNYLYTTITDENDFSSNIVLKVKLETLSNNSDIIIQENVNIYPNPSNDYITVSAPKGGKNYEIFNSQGVMVDKGSTFNNNEKINIQNLANGLYFVKFKTANVIKFIKK